MNSGNLLANQTATDDVNVFPADAESMPEKASLIVQQQPLLAKDLSNKAVHNTITSIDSNFSNSDNCSEIELDHLTESQSDFKVDKP